MEAAAKQQRQPTDAELERQVAERQRRRAEAEEHEAEREPRTGGDLIAAVADGKSKVNRDEVGDALDWFLSDDGGEDLTHQIKINVGSPNQERWIGWTIRPVDGDTLRKIRQQAQGRNRAARRRAEGEVDETEANARIVIEGTVKPDLAEAAQAQGIASPIAALKLRFRKKPGLLGQIAAEIMSLSGYDDDDVQEVEAAGN